MQLMRTVEDQLCPRCGNKIGMHTNSLFGHNPKMHDAAPTGENAPECPRSYNDLAIEKLIAWCNDAMDERDAYIQSYTDACKKRDLYEEKLVYATRELGVLASGLTPLEQMNSKAQEILYGIERIK